MRAVGNVQYTRDRAGHRLFCKTCQKETAFFRHKCLECKTGYVARLRATGKKTTFATHRKTGLQRASLRDDKKAYWARMAEESRKKFEGSK